MRVAEVAIKYKQLTEAIQRENASGWEVGQRKRHQISKGLVKALLFITLNV